MRRRSTRVRLPVRPRRALLIAAVVAVMAPILSMNRVAQAAGSSVNVVAHQDDDLLFLNPDLHGDVGAGRKVRTVFLTAGDAGRGSGYWQRREDGAKAAYADMAGVANSWRSSSLRLAGHPLRVVTLAPRPTISLVFMRLPSGSISGTGFAATGHESLERLWTGATGDIHAVDASTSYTRRSLQETLTQLLARTRADAVRTLDYRGSYGDGDHSDHHTVGYLTRAASTRLPYSHVLVGYEGYGISARSANLSREETRVKQDAFFAYSTYDRRTCKTVSQCRKQKAGTYYAWLSRRYTVGRLVVRSGAT